MASNSKNPISLLRTPSESSVGGMLVGGYSLGPQLYKAPCYKVYEGTHDMSGTPAILRVYDRYRSPVAGDPYFINRLETVAKRVQRLSHEGIVPILGFGSTHTRPGRGKPEHFFVVMPHSRSPSLEQALAGSGCGFLVRPQYFIDFLARIAEALLHAHERGVLHHALRPGNIYLTPEPDGSVSPHVTGFALLGTIRQYLRQLPGDGADIFLAPELQDVGIGDERSDIYSFGVLLLKLLRARAEFVPSQIEPVEPGPGLQQLAELCTHPTPAARPQSFDDVLAHLARFEEEPTTVVPPVAAPAPSRRWLWGAGAVVAVLAAALVAAPGLVSPEPAAPAAGGLTIIPVPPSSTASFTVESTPAGASVWSGDALLGVTPVVFSHDLSDTGTRTFELRLDGYEPRTLVWSVADGSPHLTLSAAAPKPAPKPQRRTRPRPRPAPEPAAAPDDGDFITNRRGSDDGAPAPEPGAPDDFFMER